MIKKVATSDVICSDTLYNLVDGILVSDCPLPCKRTQTQTKFLNEYKSEATVLDITFSSKVRVTKTDLVKPTLSSLLSEVGEYFFENLISGFLKTENLIPGFLKPTT